jgi:hypothetical protein
MNKDKRRVSLKILMCLAILIVTASLIGSARSPASGQANLVRVVSPADLVLKPVDVGKSTTQVEVEYDPRIARVEFESTAQAKFTVVATNKRFTFSVCGIGESDAPDHRLTLLPYEAFDAAGKTLGVGNLGVFSLGPDMTKPEVRIVSPKNGTLVSPGEAVDIVVAGEESKTATTWQTGMRRLTLVDPALNQQTSPETPYKSLRRKTVDKRASFSLRGPHDAQPGLISLTAGAEDWAKNIGFATLDLTCLPAGRTGGIWTVEGRLANPNFESTFVIYAAFSFTFNKYTHAVECGTLTTRYCGTARVSFLPGREKKVNGGWCEVKRVPASRVFKIVAHGIQKGEELTMFNIQPAEPVPIGYHEDCGDGKILDSAGELGTTIGSILPEGITIALPLLGGHTTVNKHETNRVGLNLTHKVELYQPRLNR